MITVQHLLDVSHTIAAPLFEGITHPWEVLPGIAAFIWKLGPVLDPALYDNPREGVWIAKDAEVAPSAYIAGPCIIDLGTEIRHCAFIRGSAVIGKGCVVGNSTEVKNAVLFDRVQVPHFNYVGDSVLGYRAHMGAGSITSNVKGDHSPVEVVLEGRRIATGLKKFGAILGDHAEIGCNAVLNPGVIIGRGSSVYPTVNVRGVVPANSIVKQAGVVVEKR